MTAAARPRVICHMTSSVDGRLHPSRYTDAEGGLKAWGKLYEELHDRIGADAWLVGRVTMAEMAGEGERSPAASGPVARPVHRAADAGGTWAAALDPHGRLRFAKPDIGGDPVLVVLGPDVADAHLAELAGAGVSYLVADGPGIDLAAMLATLRDAFGVETLLLEGGGTINGAFLAAGLVDELSVVVAPALDGARDADGIVAADGGLKGKVELALLGAEPLAGGVVHLRYRVGPA